MAINETLKSKREEANKIVNAIIEQSSIIEKNVHLSEKKISEIDVNTNEAKKLKASLKRIIDSTNIAILKFREEKNKISSLLTQINNFYNKKYLPLLNKIEDNDVGFKARLKQGTQFKNETLKLKELSKKQYDEVKKYASDLRTNYKELKSIGVLIGRLLDNSTKKSNKINEINSHILNLENRIKSLHKNLEKLFVESSNNHKTIIGLLKKSNDEFEEIKTIKNSSEKLLIEIQDIYEIAAETGLSGEFDKRKEQLKKLIIKWGKRIFISSAFLLIMIIMMFVLQLKLYNWDLTNHTFDINFYVRFLIASPVVYYLYFCSNQFNQAKKLHDKYSFKTTLAMSIKSHIELLTKHEKFNEKERMDKILEFVLDGFKNIYSEPYSQDDYKMKLKLANLELDLEKRIMENISKTFNVDTNNK